MHPEPDLIDRVARDMTEADPPRDFRVRVIEKLPTARPPQPLWQYAAVACGGLVLGVLIMVSMKPSSPARTTATGNHTNQAVPVSSGRATGGVTPISAGRPAPIRQNEQAIPVGPLGPVSPGEGAFQILSITPIQPSDLSIAPIIVGPLSVHGPLTLTPPNGGGRQK